MKLQFVVLVALTVTYLGAFASHHGDDMKQVFCKKSKNNLIVVNDIIFNILADNMDKSCDPVFEQTQNEVKHDFEDFMEKIVQCYNDNVEKEEFFKSPCEQYRSLKENHMDTE